MQPPLTVAFTCQRSHIWPQAWLEGLGGNDMMMHGIDVGAVAPHCGRPLDGVIVVPAGMSIIIMAPAIVHLARHLVLLL